MLHNHESDDPPESALTQDTGNKTSSNNTLEFAASRLPRDLSRQGSVAGRLPEHTIFFNRLCGSYISIARFKKRPWNILKAANSDLTNALASKEAVAVILYSRSRTNLDTNDIWPNCRSIEKLPAQYSLLEKKKPVLGSPPLRLSSNGCTTKHKTVFSPHAGRPEWKIPVEVMGMVAEYLNRDDIKALRMVSKELDYLVSQVLFNTVVVTFNTEIYGMLRSSSKSDMNGQCGATYLWKNPNSDEVYNGHGLDVFKGFGRHIRKYGMSFEVNEDTLAMPPEKKKTKSKTSFWGNYDWPVEDYCRFDAVDSLETAADETSRMTIAFSELVNVKELGLSIDSGLGWLHGPDQSVRTQVLRRPPPIFGNLKVIPDRRVQAQNELWDAIDLCHQRAASDVKLATLYRLDSPHIWPRPQELHMLADNHTEMPYLDRSIIDGALTHKIITGDTSTSCIKPVDSVHVVPAPTSKAGVLFSSNLTPAGISAFMNPVTPSKLTQAQKEWLQESEWAQQAFMSSYILSIIDNRSTFHAIHTLCISRLPDRHLGALDRYDFWEALPSLANATLMVIPSWRTVYKDEAGFVHTPIVNPASGVDQFYKLLRTHVAPLSRMRKLTIGWATGGEHEEGIFGRNKLLLPSPLLLLGISQDSNNNLTSDSLILNDPEHLISSLLHFPSVEELTLKNCWVTPPSLLQFINIHDLYSLKHLSLDSVSMTTMLKPAGIARISRIDDANSDGVFVNSLSGEPYSLDFDRLPPQIQPNSVGSHVLPTQRQFLQTYVQTLQCQIQKLQCLPGDSQDQHEIMALEIRLRYVQHMKDLQHQNHLLGIAQARNSGLLQYIQQQAIAGQLPNTVATTSAAHTDSHADVELSVKAEPRIGSWVDIIDRVSPGPNLSDFDSTHSQANPLRYTSLHTLEFVSCGYVQLPFAMVQQIGVKEITDPGFFRGTKCQSAGMIQRYCVLLPAMLVATAAHLGEITQWIDEDEFAALEAGWNLKTGWEDTEAARGAEFDGLMPGGTGRFTGIIRHTDRVTESSSEDGPGFPSRLAALLAWS